MRLCHAGPEADLAPLWLEGFGDGEDFASLYKAKMFSTENAMLLFEKENTAASAMCMTVPTKLVLPGQEPIPTGMIYGLATKKADRGKGYGKAVLFAAIEDMKKRGMGLTVLHPGNPSLYDFYKPLGFREAFYAREVRIKASPLPAPMGEFRRVMPEEYAHFREKDLHGLAHLAFDERALGFAQCLCKEAGGDLFLYRYRGEEHCLSCFYSEEDRLFCNECLIPGALLLHAASALLKLLPAKEIGFRLPAPKREANRFGLLYGDLSIPAGAYYGFDFS